MTHTPAPWKVMPAQKGKLGGIEVTTDKPWLIRDLICMMPHGPEQAQAEANARLIAAAPVIVFVGGGCVTGVLDVNGKDHPCHAVVDYDNAENGACPVCGMDETDGTEPCSYCGYDESKDNAFECAVKLLQEKG